MSKSIIEHILSRLIGSIDKPGSSFSRRVGTISQYASRHRSVEAKDAGGTYLLALPKKKAFMVKSAPYAALAFAAISSMTFAEDLSSATAPLPPGTFTTSAHSDEWKIANALSAGPASITEHAAVMDWPANPRDGMSHGRVLREGTNGWTCLPDVPGRPQHDPMCADETMMKWFMATLAGKKPDIDRVGLSYMLMGEARQGQDATPAKDPRQVEEWFTSARMS